MSAIWLLTTRARPESCQSVLDACEATGMTSPGVVWVDKGPRSEQYRKLRLPKNWSMEFAPKWGGLAAGQEWCFRSFPRAKCYGWLADDTLPRTKRWDKTLERAAGEWNIAYAKDNWLCNTPDGLNSLRKGTMLSSGVTFGGNLVRAVGWWALPGAKQAGHDTAWTSIIEPYGLHRYVEKVTVEHVNWRTGKRRRDVSDWQDWDGVAVRDAWVESTDYIETIERVKEGLALERGEPTFSIMLATRNRQEWLDRCIASILAQTRRDWELIVIDNSDQPQTLPDDPRIQHHFVPRCSIPELYNMALDKTRGEIICGIGDDDRFTPNALEVAAINIGKADWLVGRTEILNENGGLIVTRGGTRDCVDMTRRGTYMLGGAVYWRKSLSDELGGYRVEYDGAGDFDLFARFIRHSEPAVVNETMYLYTDWPGTDSNIRSSNQSQQSSRIARGE